MATLECPNVEQCGGRVRFTRFDEWDVNAHWVEIEEQDCGCDLTADQVEALCDRAAHLPMEEWAADYEWIGETADDRT